MKHYTNPISLLFLSITLPIPTFALAYPPPPSILSYEQEQNQQTPFVPSSSPPTPPRTTFKIEGIEIDFDIDINAHKYGVSGHESDHRSGSGSESGTAHDPKHGNSSLDAIDVSSGSPFAGLTTFANVPHVHCLAPGDADVDVERYDIAFLGAPFDTGVTARPGARFGPKGIRLGSWRIDAGAAWDVYRKENTFLEWAKIVDCGDAPMTFLDNTVALRQLEKSHKIISGREANSSTYTVPRIITLGGDHTTTLSALRSTFDHWGAVSVIHFDSHIDTWDPEVLGGDVSEYGGVNHGTFLHIAHEEGLVLNSSIHAGIRAPLTRRKGDLKNDRQCGFEILMARDIDRFGAQGLIDKIRARVGDNNVYISVDIDVLDPAFAPATGTAEVGGWSSRELMTVLDGLTGLKVIGADVVEVAPVYDNAGETTVLAAAEVARTLMTLMVKKPVKA